MIIGIFFIVILGHTKSAAIVWVTEIGSRAENIGAR